MRFHIVSWICVLVLLMISLPAMAGSSGLDTDPALIGALEKLGRGEPLASAEKGLIERWQMEQPARPTPSPLDDQGGPDEFGYAFVDNLNGDTATYSWIELRGDPDATWISGFASDDDGCATSSVPISFNFPFYGQDYATFTPTSNAHIMFSACVPSPYTTCLPAPTLGACILAYTYDMHLDNGGDVTGDHVVGYRDFGTHLVIEYDSLGYFSCAGGSVKFEVILYPTGRIKLQYNHMSGNCTMGTVGIQNSDGSVSLQYRCYSDGSGVRPLTEGRAIWFALPDGIPLPVTNLAGTASANTVTLTWTDPSHDTNGNPLTPDSILIYRRDAESDTRMGAVTHGIQTLIMPNQPQGVLRYFARVREGTWYSTLAYASVVNGTPSYFCTFDTTNGGWVADESATFSWGIASNSDAPTPVSGTRMWGTGMQTFYPNNACGYVELNLDLPVVSTAATVEFWANWDTYPWSVFDGSNFQVSVDSGATWEVVVPTSGYTGIFPTLNACLPNLDGWGMNSGGWQYVILPIGTYISHIPRFRITFGSSQFSGGTYSGFFFDDMSMWGLGPRQLVQGTVRHSGGTNPALANALVWASGVPDTARTDANGHYVLRLNPGTYTVNYRHATHCDSVVANVVIPEGQEITRNISLLAPSVHLEVTSLTFVVAPHGTQSQQFLISNPAAACPLQYHLLDSTQWLSCLPASGTVEPGASDTITATVLPGLLQPGDYGTVLYVHCNSQGSPFQVYVDMSVVLRADELPGALPSQFALHANYPNPFNPATLLPFDVAHLSRIEIVVYDVMGREVSRPVSGVYAPGRYQAHFNGAELPSGMYLVKMTAEGFTSTGKMLLLK